MKELIMNRTAHVPVMKNEVIDILDLRNGLTVVDATLGGGGYTREIYKRIMPGGTLIAIDQDIVAIKRFEKFYPEIAKNIHIVHSNYSHIRKVLKDLHIDHVDHIVADLGLSSDQLGESDRGFSFSHDAVLDMRMDQSTAQSALEIINLTPEEDLAHIIFSYGDERFARRIAHAICQNRPIRSTAVLADIVVKAIPRGAQRSSRVHPATRTFQAIRIAVNDEYEHLRIFLTEGMNLLQKDGKMIVVSFHSGEDRLVKNIFRSNARGCICAPEMPVCQCGQKPIVTLITRKVIKPTEEEVANNSRARSARLRAVIKQKI
jgi:16S rRNA (cytosine1402-N4)-methyltransferase